ncbi:endo-1,4-beta-xylanase [Gorillibacterium sp. sgz500922]|uniref:endo-1,4-beta-xylanase n=1 Tax=Gorillibacterium sp. sgz500922 TaxID=3446694 RepID=UPI003F66885F
MKRVWNASLAVLLLIGLLGPRAGGTALADSSPPVVASYDFEGGTAQGWSQLGSGSVQAVGQPEYAPFEGKYSLLTSGRTDAWNAPSLGVTSLLKAGAVYTISAEVKAVAAEDAGKAAITIKRTDSEKKDEYKQVAAAAVNEQGWVKLEGTYTYETAANLLLYIENDVKTARYLIDDVRIVETTPPPANPGGGTPSPGTGSALSLHADFEDGTPAGWASRTGGEKVAISTDAAHTGSHSLAVTGRTETYQGPALDLTDKATTGAKYRLSAWVRLLSGEPPAKMRMSLQVDKQGTDTAYLTVVGNTDVTDAAWVHLSADYTLDSSFDKLSLYLETAEGTPSFYLDDFELDSIGTLPVQTDIPSVYEAFRDDFPIGAAIEPEETSGRYGELLTRHFDSIVAGNAMKWDATEPKENQFNFSRGDVLADYAKSRGIGMRGHTLLWHAQVPDWLFKHADGTDLTSSAEDKALLRSRLENHIKNVVEHFNDIVYTWDVVNEVIDESQPDGFRRSKWFEILGPEFIDDAFLYARKYAKPEATLIINDYGTTNAKKRQFLYDLVKGMKARGIPVDGVGHQMHNTLESPSPAEVKQTLEMFAGLGVENQVTELDVSVYPSGSTPAYSSLSDEVALKQAYYYRDLFRLFKSLKMTAHLTGVTIWGMSDDKSWLSKPERTDYPLLFDQQLQAKPAYWALVEPSKLPVLIENAVASQGTPAIDGKSEALWEAVSPLPVKTADGTSPASFKALWNADRLFVYASIDDARNQAGDKVELYLDGDNSKSPAYGSDDRHYTLSRSGSPLEGVDYRVSERAGGYVLEASVPLAGGVVGRKIGFDVRVTDADTGAAAAWNDFTGSQDTDPSIFGTLTYGPALQLGEALPASPVVDGLEEGVWAGAPAYATNVQVEGTGGATATFKTLWDENWLYVFAHVVDASLSKASANAYEQDSVEIFLDRTNGKTAFYEPDDGQYRVNYANEQTYNGAASADVFKTATRQTDVGYDVEAAIRLTPTAASGSLLGFDLQVNDDRNADGVRDSVRIWSDPSGQSWQNTAKWGTLLLKAPSSPGNPGGTGTGTTGTPSSSVQEGSINLTTGGTLSLNGVTLVFPAGALSGEGSLRVTVGKVPESARPATPTGHKLLSDVYEIAANRTGAFQQPVTLTLPFDPAKLAEGEEAQLFAFDEAADAWAAVGSSAADLKHGTVSARVERFSTFAVLSAPKPNAGYEPSDIARHWAQAAIERLARQGIVSGYPDGTFRPDSAITRAEFVTLLANAFPLPEPAASAFADTRGHWAERAIAQAAAAGIVQGDGGGRFKPDAPLTREELAAMLARLGLLDLSAGPAVPAFKDSGEISAWARAPIAALAAQGYLQGYPDGTVKPVRACTRAEAAVLIARLLQAAD